MHSGGTCHFTTLVEWLYCFVMVELIQHLFNERSIVKYHDYGLYSMCCVLQLMVLRFGNVRRM